MRLGDYIKKAAFWFVFAIVYLVVLLLMVAFYNPDFAQFENCLLFVPLYIFITKASSIHHKQEPDNRKNSIVIVFSWAGCIALVLLFQSLIRGCL